MMRQMRRKPFRFEVELYGCGDGNHAKESNHEQTTAQFMVPRKEDWIMGHPFRVVPACRARFVPFSHKVPASGSSYKRKIREFLIFLGNRQKISSLKIESALDLLEEMDNNNRPTSREDT